MTGRKVLLASSEALKILTTRRASSFQLMCIGGFGRYVMHVLKSLCLPILGFDC